MTPIEKHLRTECEVYGAARGPGAGALTAQPSLIPGVKDKPRARPYVWVSWLTKLLAEEDRCWWKAWYKARTKYEKTPDDPERADFFSRWTKEHDELTARAERSYRAGGWVTRVEDDAEFKLVGDLADLAGKPDLVAVKGNQAEVVDAKGGRKRDSDHWQVLIYMFALPLSWLKGHHVSGVVEYKDGPEPVRPLGPEERDAIVAAVRKVAGPEEPKRWPSRAECRHCDVAACPDRWVEQQGDARAYF